MTVGQKMHTTLASLESATSSMKAFALDTQDKTAKQMFNGYASQLETICNGFKDRVNYIEQQEPTYKERQPQNH